MLEAEPFQLLICDLKMPKMDGLQVLAIVRRKYPQLRTVALTAELDEQFRSRAYALGVDLFWHKPATEQETKMFLECIESLLGRETEAGFRGVQSKSLMDIIQLECISQSSSVLRITNGSLDREDLDSKRRGWWTPKRTTCAAKPPSKRSCPGEPATSKCCPAEPSRPRTIFQVLQRAAPGIRAGAGRIARRGDGRRRTATRGLPAGATVAGRGSGVCAGDEARPEGTPGRARFGEPGAHGRMGAAEPGASSVRWATAWERDRSNRSRALARSVTSPWPARVKPSSASAGNLRSPRTRSGI